MSVGAIAATGAGTPNSPVTQSRSSDTDPAATFTNWLSMQDASSSSNASSTGGSGFPVDLSKTTAAFAAHLSNGLTVGVAALAPVSSADEQQMIQSVEQQALAFDKSVSSVAGASSGLTDASPKGVGGAIGLYDSLPDGTEFMGYSAGTADGGLDRQDLTDGITEMVTGLEKALG